MSFPPPRYGYDGQYPQYSSNQNYANSHDQRQDPRFTQGQHPPQPISQDQFQQEQQFYQFQGSQYPQVEFPTRQNVQQHELARDWSSGPGVTSPHASQGFSPMQTQVQPLHPQGFSGRLSSPYSDMQQRRPLSQSQSPHMQQQIPQGRSPQLGQHQSPSLPFEGQDARSSREVLVQASQNSGLPPQLGQHRGHMGSPQLQQSQGQLYQGHSQQYQRQQLQPQHHHQHQPQPQSQRQHQNHFQHQNPHQHQHQHQRPDSQHQNQRQQQLQQSDSQQQWQYNAPQGWHDNSQGPDSPMATQINPVRPPPRESHAQSQALQTRHQDASLVGNLQPLQNNMQISGEYQQASLPHHPTSTPHQQVSLLQHQHAQHNTAPPHASPVKTEVQQDDQRKNDDQSVPPADSSQDARMLDPGDVQGETKSTRVIPSVDGPSDGSLDGPSDGFVSMENIQPQFLMSTTTPSENVDVKILSMHLADEYISQALQIKADARKEGTDYDHEYYEKLMTTGLKLLQVNVKDQTYTLSPRSGASLQLKYAFLLFEHTENVNDIEIVLNRGIKFCADNRLPDLRYSMQHLLVRTMVKSNAKLAMRSLDEAIEEATVSKHTPWIYAFRFLRAEMVNSAWNQQTQRAAIKSLRAIVELAKEMKDAAVQVLAGVQLALLFLRLREPDFVVEAQRVLTEARSQQLNQQVESFPQLLAFLRVVDLVCDLEPFKQKDGAEKAAALKIILESLQARADQEVWSEDDALLHLPLNTSLKEYNLFMDTGGIFQTSTSTGETTITLTWLSRAEVLVWGHLLLAAAEQSKSLHSDTPGGNTFTKDKLISKSLSLLDKARPQPSSASLIRSLLLVHQTASHADRSDWTAASTCLHQLRTSITVLSPQTAHRFRSYILYLTGAIAHGAGSLTEALRAYNELFNHLGTHSNKGAVSVEDVLAILAGCSMLMILSDAAHPSAARAPAILERLAPYFPDNTPQETPSGVATYTAANSDVRSAHSFVTSIFPSATSPSTTTTSTQPSIVHTKRHLQTALSLARATSNSQLLLLSLVYLCGRFFVGTVGEQTIKSAMAAQTWALQTRSKLWVAVCDGMLGDMYERQGRAAEAARWRGEADKAMAGLDGSLRKALGY